MTPDPANPRERWLSWLGTLGDVARLRVLRLLEREELGVGELSRALQLPQSTVSRHLKPLFEQGWVTKRAEGTQSLYRMMPAALAADMRELWRMSRDHLGSAASFDEDDARLAEVLAARRVDSRTFFGRIGGDWDELRRELFGDAFVSEALLGLLPPDAVAVDIGCGTGEAAERLAPVVLGEPVDLPQRVHDELRHEPRLARRRACSEQRARARTRVQALQQDTQRACVAHRERLAVRIVPLHADGHALRERVEPEAGEGVGDEGVLQA
jgi:DNA-binding transcriptional ArsR family regulator